jgi:hypothetical protein
MPHAQKSLTPIGLAQTRRGGHDVCNGQQGFDFAVENTCEQENQIEATGPFPQRRSERAQTPATTVCASHSARASGSVGSKSGLMRAWISPRSIQSCSGLGRPQNQ